MPHLGEKGERYGLLMTDQRRIYEHSLRTKDEAPEAIIRELNVIAKRRKLNKLHLYFADLQVGMGNDGAQDGKFADLSKISYFVSDGAPELICKQLREYLTGRHGVCQYATSSYNPNHNEAENVVKIVT